jgi:hypothetical protein
LNRRGPATIVNPNDLRSLDARHWRPTRGALDEVGKKGFQAALGGLVHIDGPSRELVFDQAARFFRVVAKDRRGLVIAATLLSPGQGCRDGWTITVNADVSFAPTALGADCPISLIIGQPSEELSDTADELSDTAADG